MIPRPAMSWLPYLVAIGAFLAQSVYWVTQGGAAMILFVVGIVVGCMLGVMVSALCNACGDDDE